MKKLLLLKDWTYNGKVYKAGSIIDVDELTFDELVKNDTAEAYREIVSVEEIKLGEAKSDEINELVAAAVKASMEAVKKTDKPRIEVGKAAVEDDPKLGFLNLGQFAAEVKNHGHGQTSDRIKAVTGMSVGSDSDGGILIPPEFSSIIMEKASNVGEVWNRVTKFPISGNSMSIPYVNETSRATGSRAGGIRFYWVEEAGEKTASKPTLGKVKLNLKKAIVYVPSTDELIEDASIALEGYLTRVMGQEIGWGLDESAISGTGAGSPLGILNASCLVTQDKEGGQAANTLMAENIVNMYSRMWAPSRSNAVWFISQDSEPQLHTMSLAIGTGGGLVYMPAGGLSGQPFGTLYGRPVVPIEQCSVLGTEGDIIFADMSEYVAIQKGIKTASSIHLRFNFDETVFRAVIRVDGSPWWSSKLTPANGGPTQSPFVSLQTRS